MYTTELTASEYGNYTVESHSFLRIRDLAKLPSDVYQTFNWLIEKLAKDPLNPLSYTSNCYQIPCSAVNCYVQQMTWKANGRQYAMVYNVIYQPEPKIQLISFAEYNLALDRAEERLLYEQQSINQILEEKDRHINHLGELSRIAAQQLQISFNFHQNNGNSNHQNGSTMNNKSSNGDTHNQSGNFGIGHMSGGEIQSGAKFAGVINEAQQQNLTEAAAQIQQLLEQLDKSYPTDTTVGKMAIATEAIKQIEANPTLMARLLSAISAGGASALESFLNHPAASFVIGALQDWQETKVD